MHQNLKHSGFLYRFIFCSLLLVFLVSCGTGEISTPIESPDTPSRVEEPKEPEIKKVVTLADVERAFLDGKMPEAEQLATEFTSSAVVDKSQLAKAWRILALSAVENRHPMAALTGLERWNVLVPKANATEEWYRTWYTALTQLPYREASRRAEAVIKQDDARKKALESHKAAQQAAAEARAAGKTVAPVKPPAILEGSEPLPPQLVREAKLFLIEYRLSTGNARESLPALEELYEEAGTANQKKILEARLFQHLHTIPYSALNSLMYSTSDNNEDRYPYALIRLENARRAFWDISKQSEVRETVRFIRDGSKLSDLGVFRSWNQPDWSALSKVRVRNNAVALVLPLSGPYGNLSEKIVRGAEAARAGLMAHGKAPTLHVIDCDNPNWMYEITNLPQHVRIIGGPMRLDDFRAIRNLGLTDEHFYFTFLPRMDDGDEGLKAWRFFPSREDQVRVILDYTQNQLEVNDYAIFVPDTGEYNHRMFDLFYSQAAERELNVARVGFYPTGEYQQWVKSVANFLGTVPDQTTPPLLDFKAVFLSDNWSNSARIISHMFYNMENQLLFLGTNLWEHGLSGQQRLALRNYRLALFPGAWDQQTLEPSGQLLRASAALNGKDNADFWLSLGFDFMIMAAALDIPSQNPTVDDVNAALFSLPQLPWSGAPKYWDDQGFGSQDLYVLTPAESGFVKANPERIKARMVPPEPKAPASGDANTEAASDDSES